MDDDKLYKHHFSKEFSRILELCPKSQQKSSTAFFFSDLLFYGRPLFLGHNATWAKYAYTTLNTISGSQEKQSNLKIPCWVTGAWQMPSLHQNIFGPWSLKESFHGNLWVILDVPMPKTCPLQDLGHPYPLHLCFPDSALQTHGSSPDWRSLKSTISLEIGLRKWNKSMNYHLFGDNCPMCWMENKNCLKAPASCIRAIHLFWWLNPNRWLQ